MPLRWSRACVCVGAALLALPAATGAARVPRSAPASRAGLSAAAVRKLLNPALKAERQGDFDAALLLAQRPASIYPKDGRLRDAVAILRQEAALRHVRAGFADRARGELSSAAVEFRSALAADPQNAEARRELTALLTPPSSADPEGDAIGLRVRRAAPPIALAADPRRHDISFQGESRALIGTIAAAYGLRAYVETSVADRRVRFAVGDATFGQAMAAVVSMLGVRWTALDAHTIYVGPASQARLFAPLAVRTFYFPASEQPNEVSELAQLLRVMLAPYRVDVDIAEHALTVRASPEKLDAAERLLLDLAQPPGQVLFEVRIVATSDTVARQLGLTLPYQLQAFALGPILAQLGQTANEQQLIGELFSQGGLNALLGSGALEQQLAQLQSQLSPLLATPFAVFGGGLTAMALTIPPALLNLNLTHASTQELEQSWLAAAAGEAASLKIGERFPIVNATFSPILLNSAISKVIANGSFLQPFPSVTYEDLGLDLSLTPYLDDANAVTVKIKAQERALSGQGVNGIPILADRQLQTVIRLRDGEPAIIAGLRTEMDAETKTAVPVLDSIPLVTSALGARQTTREHQDLLVVITPHITREPATATAAIWLPAGLFAPSYSNPYRFRSF